MIAASFLPALLLIALVVVMLWFAFGTQRNVQRGNQLLGWLQTGLPLLGSRTTLRWLGSSAAQLGIREVHEPFRDAEVVVVLEPRDVSVVWAWARARRRRDFLILRGELSRPPTFELEAGDATGWTGSDGLKHVDERTWDASDWEDRHVSVWSSPSARPEVVRPYWDELRASSGGVWRLSIRREAPHLEAHVMPPDTKTVDAQRLFAAFRALGEKLAQ